MGTWKECEYAECHGTEYMDYIKQEVDTNDKITVGTGYRRRTGWKEIIRHNVSYDGGQQSNIICRKDKLLHLI